MAGSFPLQPQPRAALGSSCPSLCHRFLHAACHTWCTAHNPQRKNPERQTPALAGGAGVKRESGTESRCSSACQLTAPQAQPWPPAARTPCRGRMEDLGKPGPSGASPTPRLDAGLRLRRLRGALSVLSLRVRWGCCRGGSDGATLPTRPPHRRGRTGPRRPSLAKNGECLTAGNGLRQQCNPSCTQQGRVAQGCGTTSMGAGVIPGPGWGKQRRWGGHPPASHHEGREVPRDGQGSEVKAERGTALSSPWEVPLALGAQKATRFSSAVPGLVLG